MRLHLKESKPKKKTYNIVRVQDGYAVVDESGKQVTPANMWPLTFKSLEKLIRKELGI